MKTKTKTKKEPIKHTETWRCDTCGIDFLDDGRSTFIKHMRDVHVMPDKCLSKKSMVMALDGVDFYRNIYEWTWPEPVNVKAIQTCAGPRDEWWG